MLIYFLLEFKNSFGKNCPVFPKNPKHFFYPVLFFVIKWEAEVKSEILLSQYWKFNILVDHQKLFRLFGAPILCSLIVDAKLQRCLMGNFFDFVPQSITFTLEQWKYHFVTQKVVELPHF